jgi:hypothetical protein
LGKDLEDVRKEIARLARDKRRRFVPNSPEVPCVWQPLKVTSPASDLPFTEPGAWQYIAELVEGGHEIEVITLEKPQGETGYVMIVELTPTNLYIKVQIKGGKILGRSFHYSTK